MTPKSSPFGSGGSIPMFMSKQCYTKNLNYYTQRLSIQNIKQIKYFECLKIIQINFHILSYQHFLSLFHNLNIRRGVLGLGAGKWMKNVKTNPQRTQTICVIFQRQFISHNLQEWLIKNLILCLSVQFWLAKERLLQRSLNTLPNDCIISVFIWIKKK